MNQTLIIAGLALLAVIAAWAFGHFGTAGISAKLKAAEAIVAGAEAKAGSTVATVEAALVHPVDTFKNVEHAAVLGLVAEGGKIIAALADTTKERAQQVQIGDIITGKRKAIDDLIAQLQRAQQ
jgi:hypothetical protein